MKFSEQQILEAIAASFATGNISLTCEGKDGEQRVSDVCKTFLNQLEKIHDAEITSRRPNPAHGAPMPPGHRPYG